MSLLSFFLRASWPSASKTPLYFRNTLSGKKEEFSSLKPSEVRMYNCGPTVYDFQHIGNLRAALFADTLRRALEYNDYRVRQIVNITDVGHLSGDSEGDPDQGEDKMTAGLRREGLALTLPNMKKLALTYETAYFNDLERLNIKSAERYPRASEHIDAQIALLSTLEEKGYTYKTRDGIYFDTSRFEGYGKLGNIKNSTDSRGTRIVANPEKRSPSDFALWKFNSEIGFKSPWGTGFPGWHLECSAMSMQYLGKTLDIHTGGIDHIPIHHNNEIAQSECATGRPYARFWLHNAHLMIEGRKISKSIGNTVYLRNIEDRGFSPLSLRYLFLGAHYATPMNFTWEALEGAQTALSRLMKFVVEELSTAKGHRESAYETKFREYINDDLDTPKALALMWDLVRDESVPNGNKRATLLSMDKVLGIGMRKANRELVEMLTGRGKRLTVSDAPAKIRVLVEKREAARQEKKWDVADSIREELLSQGYTIEDSENGPRLSTT